MCGLTGFIDFSGTSTKAHLQEMTKCLVHRGPDDGGEELFYSGKTTIGLGFRRLSIIDLSSSGHQPMINESNGDVLLFNGEIYNFSEIRKTLEDENFRFKSHSDSEVILKAFEKWGVECVHRFIGMFVIVIYSPVKDKIFFFRDRAGVKPLFYYNDKGVILFASELKAFHKHPSFKKEINFDALELFFHHGYIPNPYSIFKNTHKLPPGNRMEIDLKTQEIKLIEYWNIYDHFNKPRLKISFEEASEELEKLLISSFKYRMVSDVQVGVFLSGGYDSSCVTALISKNHPEQLKTFTIGFENAAFNEAPHARKVAEHLGTDHHEYLCSDNEAREIIPMLPEIYDEPMADGGAIPNIMVCRAAGKHVKVVLSADGGDEVFAGYTKHDYVLQQESRFNRIPGPLRSIIVNSLSALNTLKPHHLHQMDRFDRLENFLRSANATSLFDMVNRTFSERDINSLMKKENATLKTYFSGEYLLNKNNDSLSKIIAVDYKTYLVDDILQKVDRATSSVSIEGREPLLDHRIAEYAATLPSEYKLKNGTGKYILRDIVHRYVPKEIMDRPKMGFGLPLSKWGMKELKPMFEEYFEISFLEKQNVFSVKKVRELYDHYMGGDEKLFDRVWVIFIFQQWWKRWMG